MNGRFFVVAYRGQENGEDAPKRKRVRSSKKLWAKYHHCHRSGTKRTHAARVTGGQSGKTRPVRKKSKKVGCTARLNVVCYRETPDKATFEFISEHVNRTPGSIEDVLFLPNKPEVIRRIEEELEKRYDVRQVRF